MRCVTAGARWDIVPHGLDALDVLRLEKGHVYLAQDTMPDDHPAKLGLGWAVATDKPAFVGKRALERMDALPLERRLVGLRFDGPPQRGHPLAVDGAIVGRDHLVRGVGGGRRPRSDSAGSGRSTASSRRCCSAGDVTATVVADPLLRPRGGAPACLSSATAPSA